MHQRSVRIRHVVRRGWPVLLAGIWVIIGMASRPDPPAQPWQAVSVLYAANLARFDTALAGLTRSVDTRQPATAVQTAFRRARLAYKHIEPLTEYYFLLSAKTLNGPNVSEGEIDDAAVKITRPEGFQVIEPWLFPLDTAHRADIRQQLTAMTYTLSQLRRVAAHNRVADPFVLDALRQEVYRIEALGITGFDSPVAYHSLPEAVAALDGIRQTLACYPLAQKDPALARRIDQTIGGAQQNLRAARSFDSFDRLVFLRQYGHPLSRLLLAARQSLGIPAPGGRRLLDPDAGTLSDPDAFNPTFFANATDPAPSPARIALGQRLFADPVLSAPGLGRSCAGCHRPDRAFQDGETAALLVQDNGQLSDQKRLMRNTPTLWNAAFQSFQFMDMRVFTVEQQVQDVIHNPREMGGDLLEAVARLRQDAAYRDQFAAHYPDGITAPNVRHALATYVRSLVSLDSRSDRFLRGTSASALLTADERLGFNVFMGKAKCATCHYFPLYNGTFPPAYFRTESEVIGTPATALNTHLSPDSGRAGFTTIDIHRGAFKIPTLRHIGQTAPYMHNGVYQSLEEVIDFYDKGGGIGLGFDLPHQSLPPEKLNLTAHEKRALVAFLKSL